MAIYTYICSPCDYRVEITKPIANCNDPELCIYCNKNMKRLYTPITAVFKGGGWGGKP